MEQLERLREIVNGSNNIVFFGKAQDPAGKICEQCDGKHRDNDDYYQMYDNI